MPASQSPAASFAFGVALLAAGASKRMGRPKLLLPWGARTVLAHLIRQWNELDAAQVGVVLAQNSDVAAELKRLNAPGTKPIVNPAPERGMFSSIQIAAAWTGWPAELTHFVVVLGDQPHLRAQTLEALLGFAKNNPAKICQPVYLDRPKHPVVLPASYFRELGQTQAGTLKEFLFEHSLALARCAMDDPGLAIDIDRPEDYAAALEQVKHRKD